MTINGFLHAHLPPEELPEYLEAFESFLDEPVFTRLAQDLLMIHLGLDRHHLQRLVKQYTQTDHEHPNP